MQAIQLSRQMLAANLLFNWHSGQTFIFKYATREEQNTYMQQFLGQ